MMPSGFGSDTVSAQQQLQATNLKTTEQKYRRTTKFLYICLGLFGLVSIIAIILGFVYSRQVGLNKGEYNRGYSAGKTDQETVDKEQALKDSIQDTRKYTSTKELGEFSFALPKSFSLVQVSGSSNPLTLYAHPDVIDQNSLFLAFRMLVKNEVFSKGRDNYDRLVKEGKLKSEEIQVDGRRAIRYIGKLEKRDKAGTVIIVEVRDKTFVMQTDNNEDKTLLEAFQSIVASTKIP